MKKKVVALMILTFCGPCLLAGAPPFLGTQYYRPPSPRPADFDCDLASIKAHGLKMIRAWILWASVNPRPGVWRWDDFDLLFDMAEKHGIKVMLQLKWDATPAWYEAAHPEQRYVSASGLPVDLRASTGQAPTGGYPGFCQHHSGARSAVLDYVRRVVERYRPRPALSAYDLWNEVQLPDCYCGATAQEYQRWLSTQYKKDVRALNRKYATEYESFQEIRIPAGGVYANMLDLTDFRQAVAAEHMDVLARTVRSLDSAHTVASHWGSQVPVLSPLSEHRDAWLMAAPLDSWGNSSHINQRELTEDALMDDILRCVATRDSAQGKPWWLAELEGGSNWSGAGFRESTETERRLRALLAFSFGAEAVIYWQWRPALFGQEASHWGLVGPDGEATRRSEDVRRLAEMLDRHSGLLGSLRWRQPEVALLYEPRTVAFERIAPGRDRLEQGIGSRNFNGCFRALIDGGHDPEILNAALVARDGVPTRTKVLIAPFSIIERPGLRERVKDWVAGGGTLMAGPLFSMLDESTWLNTQTPPPAWAQVFGARQADRFYVPAPVAVLRPSAAAAPEAGSKLPGQLLHEVFRLEGAAAVGEVREQPVITSHQYGKGKAILMGSFFGAAYRNRGDALRPFLDSVAKQTGVSPRVKATGALARIADSPQGPVVFLFNFTDRPIQAELTVADSGSVVDLWTDRKLGEMRASETWKTELPGKGSQVFLIRKE